MKTKLHSNLDEPVRRTRRSRATAFATMAALVLTGLAAAALPARAETCEPCATTARYVYNSDINEAQADYQMALANASNEPTDAARSAARKKASVVLKEDKESARAQFDERRDLCEDLGESRYNPVIKPADFLTPAQTAAKPNRLFPLVPGTTFTYRSVGEEGTEIVTVQVTRETRVILGVTCIVVRDTVKVDGSIIEDTIDWYAQDRTGNVWYFGENTAEYEDGLITSLAGAWEAGVNNARPGIAMLAQPTVGKVYRQELSYGEAEDAAEVIALNETVRVAYGTFAGCLKTEDFTPLDPDSVEFKFYAPGVGNVLTLNPETGKRSELISVVRR